MSSKTRKCPCCKKTKDSSHFHKDRSTGDGLKAYCKICTAEKFKKRYYADKEKYAENHPPSAQTEF